MEGWWWYGIIGGAVATIAGLYFYGTLTKILFERHPGRGTVALSVLLLFMAAVNILEDRPWWSALFAVLTVVVLITRRATLRRW